MTGEAIKSFLVGLGFDVNDSELAKFNKAINSATLRVTALYGAMKIAAAGIVYGISKISEGFESLGYEYHILAPAVNKALILRRELLKAYQAAGINIVKVIQNSVKLNLSLTKTRFAFEAIYRSVASRFFETLIKHSDQLRKRIYDNMPKILSLVERFVKFIFHAVDAMDSLASRLWSILGRVYDFLVQLDRATDGWSTRVLAVVAAWKLLNLSFLLTPIGALVGALTTLLALYDDFKTFEEGGESLLNWGPFVPVLKQVGQIFDQMLVAVTGLLTALKDIATLNFGGLIGALRQILNAIWEINRIKTDITLGLFKDVLSRFAGPMGPPAPLGVGGNNNSTVNQTLHQQTQIQVTGTADANSIGAATAAQQTRVNHQLARNMKAPAQ